MSMDCAMEKQDGGPVSASASSSSSQHQHQQHQRQQQQYENDRKISAERSRIRAEIAKEDAMIYLDGPQIYTCGHCRTHLTSHDDIISKSFHGRHGRAYLFDQCVNVHLGKPENRTLITGIHSVCDIFCDRCQSMVGWTYIKAFEPSQKYKEGKFIIEKINLHLEETVLYGGIEHPAGERRDRGRARSMNWGRIRRDSEDQDESHTASGRSWSSSRQLNSSSHSHSHSRHNSHNDNHILDSPSSTRSIIYEYKAAARAATGSHPTGIEGNSFRSTSTSG